MRLECHPRGLQHNYSIRRISWVVLIKEKPHRNVELMSMLGKKKKIKMLKHKKTEKDKRIRKKGKKKQQLRWSSSVFPGVLCGKAGDRFKMGEHVKVVLELRSALLNKKSILCKDKFEAKLDS